MPCLYDIVLTGTSNTDFRQIEIRDVSSAFSKYDLYVVQKLPLTFDFKSNFYNIILAVCPYLLNVFIAARLKKKIDIKSLRPNLSFCESCIF